MPRWARSGSRRSRTRRALPEAHETIDDEILAKALALSTKAKADGKPFFLWLNPRACTVVTHLSDKYEESAHPGEGWSIQEAAWPSSTTWWEAVMKR